MECTPQSTTGMEHTLLISLPLAAFTLVLINSTLAADSGFWSLSVDRRQLQLSLPCFTTLLLILH